MAELTDLGRQEDLRNAQLLQLYALEARIASQGQFFTGGERGDESVYVGQRPDIAPLRGSRIASAYLLFPSGVDPALSADAVNRSIDRLATRVEGVSGYKDLSLNTLARSIFTDPAEYAEFTRYTSDPERSRFALEINEQLAPLRGYNAATGEVYMGARERMEWQERQSNPFGLARSDFDTDAGRDALARALISTGQLSIESGQIVGPAEKVTTPEMVMSPPAPDMGGVWDSRISAGDVDSFRGFNEPVRFGYGQSPLSYAGPSDFSNPSSSDGGLLSLITIAGIFLALWR